MKKTLLAAAILATAWACTPKANPTATNTGSNANTTRNADPAPVVATAPVNGSRADAAAAVEAGHKVYDAKCGRCHGLKDPANYTAERWVPILQSMAPKARLSDEETAQVKAYVQANAKKS